jgi:geranylgeranyl pyrophosphate synthase
VKHKICIVRPQINSSCYEEVIGSISQTDWTEVDHETFCMLNAWQTPGDYTVLEMPDQHETIKKTVADYIAYIKRLQQEEQQKEQQRELKKQQRELKKRAKTEQEEKQLLEQLKQKYATTE